MVEVRIHPVAPKVGPDEVGTLAVCGTDQPLNVRRARKALLDARDSFGPGRINKNVKNIFAAPQHALGSPADNHAVASLSGFFDHVLRQRRHRFRIEKVWRANDDGPLKGPSP